MTAPSVRTHLSNHAALRARQRGIPPRTLDLLLQFGTVVHDHCGGRIVVFDRAARARVSKVLGKAAAQLKLDVFAVLAANAPTVITIGHRTRRVYEGA